MIYVQGRFLFIHIPRSGGMSIRAALRQVVDPLVAWEIDETEIGELSRHVTAPRMRSTITDYDSILKFAVYRHPTDVIKSDYALHRKDFDRVDSGELKPGWNATVKLAMSEGLGQFAARRWQPWTGNQTIWNHWTGGDKTIQKLRFDHLAEDFAAMLDKLGLPPVELPHLNAAMTVPGVAIPTSPAIESPQVDQIDR